MTLSRPYRYSLERFPEPPFRAPSGYVFVTETGSPSLLVKPVVRALLGGSSDYRQAHEPFYRTHRALQRAPRGRNRWSCGLPGGFRLSDSPKVRESPLWVHQAAASVTEKRGANSPESAPHRTSTWPMHAEPFEEANLVQESDCQQ